MARINKNTKYSGISVYWYVWKFIKALKRVPSERRNEAILIRKEMLRKKGSSLYAEYQWKEMPTGKKYCRENWSSNGRSKGNRFSFV